MIVFYGEGRFGNQIFQYQALSALAASGERLLAFGLEELQASLLLHGPRLTVITRRLWLKRLVKFVLLPLLLRPLFKGLRLGNYAYEHRHGEPPRDGPSGRLVLRAGLLRKITLVDGGFFQRAGYWDAVFPTPLFELKPALRLAARRTLEALDGGDGPPRTFVHVRRSDYLTHTDYGLTDIALPERFYRTAIQEMQRRAGRSFFVFVTDDAAWVARTFADIAPKAIVSSDAVSDFAVMAECSRGILSNSTFSLAAALMLREPSLVIGPEFWFGFRVGAWYPPEIEFKDARLAYLAVAE